MLGSLWQLVFADRLCDATIPYIAMTLQKNNPLHGITLKVIIEELVAHYGWEHLATKIKIKCFIDKPTINSSLKFLRQTPWARTKVEDYYIWTFYTRTGERKSSVQKQ